MYQKITNGWELAKQSFTVLRLDKELLLFPALSGLASLAVMASFALPLWGADILGPMLEDQRVPQNALTYVLLFAYYFANYFVIVFFNVALIECAIIRFRGGNPTVSDGLHASWRLLPKIVGWALVSATVGVILAVIESFSKKVGGIVSGLLGMAWSAATFFVVPVLVVENVGPIEATKRSLAVLRKSWGEALVSNFGIGALVMLACLVAAIPAVIGVVVGSTASVIMGIAISVPLMILISLMSAAVHAIAQAALYLYASEGTVPPQFEMAALRQAFVAKR